MEKKGKLTIILLCVFLAGCKKPAPSLENRIVTEVRVQLQEQQQSRQWTLRDPQKMEVVLFYLRSLDRQAPAPSDPERFGGRQFSIELTYTDGTKCQIFQRADRFLSRDLGQWQTIDQKKGAFLYPLLKNLNSD